MGLTRCEYAIAGEARNEGGEGSEKLWAGGRLKSFKHFNFVWSIEHLSLHCDFLRFWCVFFLYFTMVLGLG
jgi:hypothetical protein